MHVAILSGHRAVPNPGMMGGSAGELGRNAIRRNDGRIEAGEAVEIVTPTGAGGEGGLPAGAPLPQLAGEGGAERRMGYGPLRRRQPQCTTVTANLCRRIPAFHTPSGLRPPSPLRREGEPADAYNPMKSLANSTYVSDRLKVKKFPTPEPA